MITFRKADKIDRYGIFKDGAEIGWMAKTEDAAGYFWAWHSFSDGRFKGTACRNVRLASLEDARADARQFLDATA